jgi:hypothetical protein
MTLRFLIKILVSALVIAGASELAKRASWVSAILVSLPLTSILALSWLYWDTGDAGKVSELSMGILWAVLPSLLFFWILPILLRAGMRFPPALLVSCVVMFLGYSAYVWVLRRIGVGSL